MANTLSDFLWSALVYKCWVVVLESDIRATITDLALLLHCFIVNLLHVISLHPGVEMDMVLEKYCLGATLQGTNNLCRGEQKYP